ncbi:uncharacterized protein LOC123262939 isoform X2 [Cotesia glomerata]|uniref:Odorant receptor n=1 Tax=Cotesia glomerata TaxID=32391 RepID=A0AAV7ILW7_COTGL|nr:uncharacterized protein LOC123262939 isoform X2 [Cotesia glomerata]KAH0553536.1 hypothetical protein KQX54_002050 [Cotesia glomerata]
MSFPLVSKHSKGSHGYKMFKVDPEFAIAYTKLTVTLVCSWPPGRNSSKRDLVVFNVKWWISWLLGIFLVVPLIYAAVVDRKNVLEFTKSLCLAVSCGQCAVKMFFCKLQNQRIKFLLDEMEEYVKASVPSERQIFLNYIKNCGLVHVVLNVCSLVASIGVILGPLVLPQRLPTEAKYPFSVETHPNYEIIYVHQAFAGVLCSSIGSIDCQIAMLLWYSIARLDILSLEMEKITSVCQFYEFVDETIKAGRCLVATTVIMTTLAVILGGVHIVGNEPLIAKLQFVIIVGGFSMLLYVTAWPSEILTRMCENVGWTIYNSPWLKNSKELNKGIEFVIQRSNKPAVISLSGVFPALSLNYYATFLSKTFSYFTTLRIILAKME